MGSALSYVQNKSLSFEWLMNKFDQGPPPYIGTIMYIWKITSKDFDS